jgi:hypothetical protein
MKASSLFNLFGRQMPPMNSGFANMMTQFNQFKQNFQGDPKQQVQQLLDSGQMSQEQFNKLSQMATQMQNMMQGGRF